MISDRTSRPKARPVDPVAGFSFGLGSASVPSDHRFRAVLTTTYGSVVARRNWNPRLDSMIDNHSIFHSSHQRFPISSANLREPRTGTDAAPADGHAILPCVRLAIMADQSRRRPVGNPAWQKGGPSPNPSGRGKGAAALAKYVASQTNDGRELIDRLLEIVRNPVTNQRLVVIAIELLADRLVGKAVASVDLDMTADITASARPTPQLPAGWRSMSSADRTRWLDETFGALPLQLAAGVS